MKTFSIDFETLDFTEIGQWPSWVQHLFAILNTIIILSLGHFFIFETIRQEIKNITSSHLALKLELEESQDSKRSNSQNINEQSLLAEIQKVELLLDNLKEQLPIHNQETKVLETLSELALQCRLQINNLKPKAELQKNSYIEYPIGLMMKGDFYGMADFLNRLSKVSPILSLSEFNLHYNKVTQTLVTQLLLKTYVSKVIDPVLVQESANTQPYNTNIAAIATPSAATTFAAVPSVIIPSALIQSKPVSVASSPTVQQNIAQQEAFQENTVQPYPPQPSQEKVNIYSGENFRNPFEISNIETLETPLMSQDKSNSTTHEIKRPKTLLELYSLDALKMVGYIEAAPEDQQHPSQFLALIKDNTGTLHCVKVGDYLGQNEGKITKIDTSKIEINEGFHPKTNNHSNFQDEIHRFQQVSHSESLRTQEKTIILPLILHEAG